MSVEMYASGDSVVAGLVPATLSTTFILLYHMLSTKVEYCISST